MLLLATFFVAVAVVSGNSDKVLYGLLGGDVTLELDAGSVTDTTKSIWWKVGADLAIELDEGVIQQYRHFKERGNLNATTGAMTIIKLLLNDSNTYVPYIDSKPSTPTRLIVISAVPEPTIKTLGEMSDYRLTCNGNVIDAGDVSYTWTSDNKQPLSTQKDFTITKNDSDVKEFTCTMKNQLSSKTSKPFTNPRYAESSANNLNISKGVTVFICLLLPLLLLGIFHRIKTGMWFYEKSSLPWEAEFWRKNERQQLESNGTDPPQPGLKSDEETAMTQI